MYPQPMRLPKVNRVAEHFVIGDQERKLYKQGQAAADRVYLLPFVELSDLLLHVLFSWITHAVLFIFFLDRLHLRLQLLHLERRFHLVYAQRQQGQGDDESLKDDRPTPVVGVLMKPAQADESPFEERPGNGSPPAKVQYIAQIFVRAGDGWNGDRIQHLQ